MMNQIYDKLQLRKKRKEEELRRHFKEGDKDPLTKYFYHNKIQE